VTPLPNRKLAWQSMAEGSVVITILAKILYDLKSDSSAMFLGGSTSWQSAIN